MALLLRRTTRRRQPTVPLAIDPQHDIGRSVIEAGYMLGARTGYSASTRRILVPSILGSGTITAAVTIGGAATKLNATSSANCSFINLGRSFSHSSGTGITMLWRGVINSLSVLIPLFTSASDGVAQWPGHYLSVNTAGTFFGAYGDTSGTGTSAYRRATSSTTLTVGQFYTIAAVCRGATDWSLYVDGVSQGAPSYSGSGGYAAGTANGAINRRDDSGQQTVNSWLYLSRALADAEIQSLYEAPFQFLMPIRRRVWVAVNSGGAVTMGGLLLMGCGS